MALDDFIKTWDGKPLEAEDPTNLDQCFDLAFGYLDFLSIPRDTIRHLYAYQIYTNPSVRTYTYFDLINNTPTGVPAPGDLVVWGTSVGMAGHVAIFVSGDMNSFVSFDQNWAGKRYCTKTNHNYSGVIGWLHPKAAQVPLPVPIPVPSPITITDQTKIDLGGDLGIMEVGAIRSTILDQRREIDNLKKEVQQNSGGQPTFLQQLVALFSGHKSG